MNVVFMVGKRQVVAGLRNAKQILNNLYQGAEQIYVEGEKIEISEDTRLEIVKQLHGQIYV